MCGTGDAQCGRERGIEMCSVTTTLMCQCRAIATNNLTPSEHMCGRERRTVWDRERKMCSAITTLMCKSRALQQKIWPLLNICVGERRTMWDREREQCRVIERCSALPKHLCVNAGPYLALSKHMCGRERCAMWEREGERHVQHYHNTYV